jgi:hypothetical protein
MDLLDEVVGPQSWQDHYREVAGKVYCDLSLNVGGEWITKSDCGAESHFEREKGQASDAFKRAAVKWGIGRFLYQLPTFRTKAIEVGKDDRGNPRFFPADPEGNRIYNLTGYIQGKQKALKRETPRQTPREETKPAQPKQPSLAAVPVAVKAEPTAPTQDQCNELAYLRDTLGWTKEQFGIWLKEHFGHSWNQMDRAKAARAIEKLESYLPKELAHA